MLEPSTCAIGTADTEQYERRESPTNPFEFASTL